MISVFDMLFEIAEDSLDLVLVAWVVHAVLNQNIHL